MGQIEEYYKRIESLVLDERSVVKTLAFFEVSGPQVENELPHNKLQGINPAEIKDIRHDAYLYGAESV